MVLGCGQPAAVVVVAVPRDGWVFTKQQRYVKNLVGVGVKFCSGNFTAVFRGAMAHGEILPGGGRQDDAGWPKKGRSCEGPAGENG